MGIGNQNIQAAGQSSIGELFHSSVSANRQRVALVDGNRTYTYDQLEDRSNRVANLLKGLALEDQDRICVLAHNCAEYVEIVLGAAKVGIIVSVLNWRLSERELQHSISLVEPKCIFVDASLNEALGQLDLGGAGTIKIGEDYEARMAHCDSKYPDRKIDPEYGLYILYTSGTTGLPKGALVSHRALIARGMVFIGMLRGPLRDNFIAWTPMYHMVAADQMLAVLISGGTVYSVDGYQPDQLMDMLETVEMSWFPLVPGMVGDFVARMKKRNCKPKNVGSIGAMADLIPRADIAEATRLFKAPYRNTFGATETGIHPATSNSIPIGEASERLPKEQTPFCDLRLVDEQGNEVPVGTPGEVSIAGPTVFSGYWNNEEANNKDFRGGRFRSGDLLRRNPDGTLEYVDRAKYMIKSGGENIYPAEIENVLAGDQRIETAIVVRKMDDRWGEIPVLYVVRRDERLSAPEIISYCRGNLSTYKCPREVRFIKDADIPRSTTGKIQRHILEKMIDSIAQEKL